VNVQVTKELSANDIGATGTHQAGILVPKAPEILSFFPTLNRRSKNPRAALVVREKRDGTRWIFNFIYYNNAFFGGTRNEYRLTCMTKYLRATGARVGDELVFSKNEEASILVDLQRSRSPASVDELGTLVLGSGWRIINI
jgi:hypothetical protein